MGGNVSCSFLYLDIFHLSHFGDSSRTEHVDQPHFECRVVFQVCVQFNADLIPKWNVFEERSSVLFIAVSLLSRTVPGT